MICLFLITKCSHCDITLESLNLTCWLSMLFTPEISRVTPSALHFHNHCICEEELSPSTQNMSVPALVLCLF